MYTSSHYTIAYILYLYILFASSAKRQVLPLWSRANAQEGRRDYIDRGHQLTFSFFFYNVTWRSRVVFFSFFFFWPSVDQQHQLVVPNFPLCEVFMSRLPILFLIIFSFTNKKPWWNQTPKGGRRPFAVSITTRLESTRRAAPVPYWYGRCMCAQHRRRGEPAIQSINHDQAD